ncbi:MAG TPA: PKD domain-containing protein [Anaerolineae bacterium]|nr:PKD domain-containing protein [Anaerolineae bacterium]
MKRFFPFLVGGFLPLLALTALVLGLAGRPQAAHADPSTLYVRPDCTGWPDCYTSIQAAVDAAAPADEILIATGVYTGVQARAGITQVVYVSKSLTLRGGYNPDFTAWDPDLYPTTVDAQGLGRGVVISGPATVTLDGLRITGGNATGLGGFLYNVPLPGDEYDAGGGVAVLSATLYLFHGVISGNLASAGDRWAYGGGLFLDHAAGRIEDTRFFSNTASSGAYGEGAGMCLFRSRNVTLQANEFLSNTSSITDAWGLGALGGAFSLWASEGVTLTHNTFRANRAHCATCQGDGHGGGLSFWECSAYLEGNLIAANVAAGSGQTGRGGGILLKGTRAVLAGNLILDNRAAEGGTALGGGLFITGTGVITLVNNVLARNVASSTIELTGTAQARLLHTTLADNDGWALRGAVSTTAMLTNTIVAGNDGGFTGTGTISPAYTLFWQNAPLGDGITGTTVFTGDPAFADVKYHLGPASAAALDRALDVGVTTDIDREPRPAAGRPDLGADEYVIWKSDLSGNAESFLIPGQTYTYTHYLENKGNVTDTYDLTLDSVWGALATSTPITLGGGQWTSVLVRVFVPADALSGTVQVGVLTATSRFVPSLQTAVHETTTVALVGGILLEPNRTAQATPGQTLRYTHTLHNQVNYTQTFSLAAASSAGFPLSLSPDPTLAPRAAAVVTLTVQVPPGLSSAVTDRAVLTATGSVSGTGCITDTTAVCIPPAGADFTWLPAQSKTGETVRFTATITAGSPPLTYTWAFGDGSHGQGESVAHTYAQSDTYTVRLTVTNPCGQAVAEETLTVTGEPLYGAALTPITRAAQVAPGGAVVYTHTLRNTGAATDTYTVTLTSSQGWARLASSGAVRLDSQATAVVTVAVTVPPTATVGAEDVATIQAVSWADPGVAATAVDTTTVALGAKRHVYLPLVLRNR